MPDEVPVLVQEYTVWLNAALSALQVETSSGRSRGDNADIGMEPDFLERVLALACDAHTRFVFVHPFMDGNGRLARTLAALVMQRFGLPAPMILRSMRRDYMAAVSAATSNSSYTSLATIFATALQRSIACQLQLAAVADSEWNPLLAVVASDLARAGCLLYDSY